jgi:hypothetical protein
VFIPQRTIYNLHFEDPALAELEMQVYACTVAQFNEIMSGANLMGDEAVQGANKLLELFASHIVKWNMADESGKELPKTAETLGNLEQPLVIRIIAAWQAAMVTVPNPSRTRSYSGGPSEEASLGLANGSASQPSWPQ